MRRWVFSEDEVLKPLEQMSQMWGFSPVCVRRWRVNRLGRSNSLPQCSQGSMVRFLIFLVDDDWLLLLLLLLWWPINGEAATATTLLISEPDRSMGRLVFGSILMEEIETGLELADEDVMLVSVCLFVCSVRLLVGCS